MTTKNKDIQIKFDGKDNFIHRFRDEKQVREEEFNFGAIEGLGTNELISLVHMGKSFMKILMHSELLYGQWKDTSHALMPSSWEYYEAKNDGNPMPYYFVLTPFALFTFHPKNLHVLLDMKSFAGINSIESFESDKVRILYKEEKLKFQLRALTPAIRD